MNMTAYAPESTRLSAIIPASMPTAQSKSISHHSRMPHEARAISDVIDEMITPDRDVFDDETPCHDIRPLGNTADVAYQIKQINQLLQDAEALKSQAQEAQAFYERRITAVETRASMLRENCGRFLKANSMQRLVTHSGTIFFSKRTKVTLPDDESLLKFASLEDPSHSHGLVIEKPNKSELKKYIASTGRTPEGYLEEQIEQIVIRKVA